MTGTVELAPDGAHLLIRFPYREDLVAIVRDLPGRRWDPKGKSWRVPCAQVELVYATFSRHLFQFAPEVSSLLAGTLGAAPAAAAATSTASPTATAAPADDAPALTVSALNQLVRDALRAQFQQPLWVVGEIVDFDKQVGKRHRWFRLVERGDGDRQRASVEVVLFERTAEQLLLRLERGEPPLRLQDGIEIRALVRVDLYQHNGCFQLVIDDVDPAFTLGKLALGREQILRELRQAGLADRNRSLPLPVPPLRIGLLSSPDADGCADFLRHLQESAIAFDVTLVPVRVQGPELRPSVLAGLRWFAERAADFDALCVVRGGGSRTDLAWFDDREVAFAVARHPLKVLVGIGHQRDESVLDLIAHGEKTPTAVAGYLVGAVAAARQLLAEQARRLGGTATAMLAAGRQRLDGSVRDLQAAVQARIGRERGRLGDAGRTLTGGARRCLHDAHRRHAALLRELGAASRLQLQRVGSGLDAAAARLRHGGERELERAGARLDAQAARQRLLDPMAVLRRGYALLRGDDGRVRTSAAQLRPDQFLVLRLRDGSVRARTLQVDLDARQEP